MVYAAVPAPAPVPLPPSQQRNLRRQRSKTFDSNSGGVGTVILTGPQVANP